MNISHARFHNTLLKLLLCFVAIGVGGCAHHSGNNSNVSVGASTATGALTLFETPRDKDKVVLDAIHSSRKQLDVVIYEFTDSDIEAALVAAHRSGVTVRVIFNEFGFQKARTNDPVFKELQAAGIMVKFSSKMYRLTHEKAIIVDPGLDNQEVLIMTMNLGPGYLGKGLQQSLNFGIVDQNQNDISKTEEIFEADWNQRPYLSNNDAALVVSPIDSRRKLLEQIITAQHSIHFYAQLLTDQDTIDALMDACRRGVEVEGLIADMKDDKGIYINGPGAEKINKAGGKILFLVNPFEHAKATIIDGGSVYIGSINFSKPSITENRELGIITTQPDVVNQMRSEFDKFWALGVPLAHE